MRINSDQSIILMLAGFLFLFISHSDLNADEPVKSKPSIEWGQSVDGLRSSLTAEKSNYVIGEPILLGYQLENRSPHEVMFFFEGYHSRCFRMEIFYLPKNRLTKKNGKSAEKAIALTRYGKSIFHGTYFSSMRRFNIGSSSVLTWDFGDIPINHLYDMTLPGKYDITTKRMIDNAFVTTNTLRLTIVRPQPVENDLQGPHVEPIKNKKSN
ncbi:hypothetical protein [uncultured Gimesia sp.]|uniref:hypothetical protein n=1 Tax=uncultured Gimesia sp. TaxID=1678688 RepID=UPI0030D879A0